MSCMYNSTIPPWMMNMYQPQQPQGDPNWERAIKFYDKLQRREIRKQLKKEEEDKKKKPPKRFRDFTFLETFAILTVASPWLGPLISMLQHSFVETVLR